MIEWDAVLYNAWRWMDGWMDGLIEDDFHLHVNPDIC